MERGKGMEKERGTSDGKEIGREALEDHKLHELIRTTE